MTLRLFTRGLLRLYALWLVLQALPRLIGAGQVAAAALRDRGPDLARAAQGPCAEALGALVAPVILTCGWLAGRVARGLQADPGWGDGLLRAGRAVVGAGLVLAALPMAAEPLWRGFRPGADPYRLPAGAVPSLAVAALWLTAGLALVLGGRVLARALARALAQRPRR